MTGKDRLGWYGPAHGAHATDTEILLDSMSLEKYRGVPGSKEPLFTEGLAMKDDALTSICVNGPRSERTNYILDRASSTWIPIDVPPMGGYNFTPILIGSEGDNFIFKYGQESGAFSVVQ